MRRAVGEQNVNYPVAIDSDYAIRRAFDNRFWPALYFVDAQGRIRHRHFGEGEYERAEQIIQELLIEAGHTGIDRTLVSVEGRGAEAAPDWRNLRSAETYIERSYGANGKLAHRFHARDLHLVMGPAKHGTPVRFRVRIDGQPPHPTA